MKSLLKYLFLFAVGGGIYYGLEMLWRGYSHWTMFILGGICFICLGLINIVLSWRTPLQLQMLIGCGIITILKFITGCIVNIGMGWNIWDYSNFPLNFMGQISLPSSILWFFLSAVGIVIDDYIRYYFFDEHKPVCTFHTEK